jgi:hypothetical protein
MSVHLACFYPQVGDLQGGIDQPQAGFPSRASGAGGERRGDGRKRERRNVWGIFDYRIDAARKDLAITGVYRWTPTGVQVVAP